MAIKFERKLPIILLFGILMLTMIGVVFYQNTVSLQQAIDREKRTTDVLYKLNEIQTLVLALDSGMQGFILTGNETYLDPAARSKSTITANLNELRELKSNSPEQLKEFHRLENLIDQSNEEIDRKIELRRQMGLDYAVGEITTHRSRTLSAGIRDTIERAKNAEVAEMEQRDSLLDERLTGTIQILIISSILGVLALVFANVIVHMEIKRRRAAEVTLLESNRDLEAKVERRTKELKAANEHLREIDSERQTLLLTEREARQEAEVANRLRDEFMATISHELKTPLNSILGWARLLAGAKLNPDQSAKAVDTIIKNSETQNRLIEDLLDVAKVFSNKLELEMTEVDPAAIVNDSIESIRPASQAKGITIGTVFDESINGHKANGDENRLHQVVGNLLTNAVKFTPEGGRIDVRLGLDGPNFELVVSDTGIGIGEEFMSSVFERFRQENPQSDSSRGLGLGLAIVRNLVEMHGGSVKVKSEGLGKGTEFTVLLPVAK